MIIITKKLRPRRLVAGCALAAVAIAAVGAGLDLIQDVQTAQAVVQLQANPENVKTNDDRVAYLESCGWLVGEEAANQEDIRLPDVFDDSYEAYLTLQESQGFDLTQYAGKTIQRYTYAVKNFPGLQENIWASLLLYQDHSSRDTGSRPEVGSSRISNSAWCDSAKASRYFTFMPFESSLNFLLSSKANRLMYFWYCS